VPGLIAGTTGSDWSLGGSLLTFLFPMCLFIVVAAVLYVLLSRPHKVPGHRSPAPAAGPGTMPSAAAAAGMTGTETAGRGDGAGSPPAEDGE